ncbi:major facilitator superfamily domain-containing protein [Mycena vitilis]|nr:major facilitator superfamily domain-containing protein [Mycena vitilis]
MASDSASLGDGEKGSLDVLAIQVSPKESAGSRAQPEKLISNTTVATLSGVPAPEANPKHALTFEEPPLKSEPKSREFWMCIIALLTSSFLSALDSTAVGTALPTIAAELHDDRGDYIWVGSAYALSSTAFIPLGGNLADVFGRKWIMLVSIASFVVGSALAGAAQNMPMMIGARTIQGIGGGGIFTLADIITADLVPLSERGLYQGLFGMAWAMASFTGPLIGGGVAQRGNSWRWLFYVNIPVGAIAFVLVLVFLSVKRPSGSVRQKLAKVDWVGNALVITGTGLANIGLTWGGIRYHWVSAQVLSPLITGLFLLVVFAVYEAKFAAWPAIAHDIVGNRTSVSALLTKITHGMITIAMLFYLPVFFQACLGATPIRSAVYFLPAVLAATIFGLLAMLCITYMKKYRLVNWAGWCISVLGFGLISTMRADTSTAQWVGFQILTALGVGPLFEGPVFPLLAPLPTHRAASALALISFTRAFAQTWGLTISSTILQNSLQKTLPAAFVAQFPPGFEIAYAAIPVIRTLEEPLRTEVRAAFADSMAKIWQTMVGISGLGLLFSLLMKEIPMATTVNETYALVEKEHQQRHEGEMRNGWDAQEGVSH